MAGRAVEMDPDGDGGKKAEKKGGDRRIWVIMALAVFILATQALAVFILAAQAGFLPLSARFADYPAEAGAEADPEAATEGAIGGAEGPDAPLDEENMRALGWISAETVRRYAREHNINTEFLSRLFPDKIIYKQAGEIVYADIDPGLRRHGHDWRALGWNGQRPVYTGEDALFGIDVSRYQGEIDWGRVAGDGVGFAMVRLGYRGYSSGALTYDEFFESNMRGASQAGVRLGVYFFSQAVTPAEAVEEADMVIDSITPYGISLPIAFDMEDISGEAARTDSMTAGQVTDVTIAFCERIKEAGYTPLVYANPNWFLSRMELDRLEPYGKWLAQYYRLPAYPYDFSMWQFSSTGSIDGIKGNVDLNLAFGL
ncbi:MAG: glycoside hydrolase family 25 protein [Clostridiales Family XIII bacterium]|jgi:GH25 family lysozyme M1 (1,4-beta-N-acetylmuramidase)|nr:glycoside hydrolase family 25 protein [Clostridiales Family XIII bacterium]